MVHELVSAASTTPTTTISRLLLQLQVPFTANPTSDLIVE